MTIWLHQVINNTSHTLNYHNLETGLKVTVLPKMSHGENDEGWIPASKVHRDMVPHRNPNLHIWFDNERESQRIDIADQDYKIRIVGRAEEDGWRVDEHYGRVEHDGEYILRLDEVVTEGRRKCAVSFLAYEEKCRSEGGYVRVKDIQRAKAIFALVMFDVFS